MFLYRAARAIEIIHFFYIFIIEDKRSEFQVLASDFQSTPIYKNESYFRISLWHNQQRKIKLWLIDR